MQQPGFAGLHGAIVEDRNDAALEVLREELATDGIDDSTRIAVFYGAAHLPDFDERSVRKSPPPKENVSQTSRLPV